MDDPEPISRTIKAPRSAVWRALTEPDLLNQWRAPDGMTAKIERFELRPGGGYRMSLIYDDASQSPGKSAPDRDIFDGVFEVVELETRMVERVTFDSDDADMARPFRTVTELADAPDGGTNVTMSFPDLPTSIPRDANADGTRQSLAHLARLVEGGG